MSKEADWQEAVANCDRDPIHIPGTIQPYGVLVALDEKFKVIEQVSQNSKELLGMPTSELLGQSVEALLNEAEFHKARNCLSHASIEEQREVVGEKVFLDNRFQLSIHRKDSRSILEFLPLNDTDSTSLEQTRALYAKAVTQHDTQSVIELAVHSLRDTSGYDRVCAYRFLPDDSGEIIAESRDTNVDSFLGMRFPATDIPPIARKLYTDTPIRIISDVLGKDCPIVGLDSCARPLDLSLAVLRGTAVYHTQYLQNMGVKSTLTLPIIVNGALWGMFAMHHMTPRISDASVVLATELTGKMLGLVIQQTTQLSHQSYFKSCTDIAHDILKIGMKEQDINVYWDSAKNTLRRIIPCSGIAYIVDERIEKAGSTPTDDACLQIKDLGIDDKRALRFYDNLQAMLPVEQLEETKGALIMTLSEISGVSLILFRDAAANTITWAGAPKNKVVQGDKGLELSPRNSFEQYLESVDGKSLEWSNDNVEVASVLRDTLLSVLQDTLLRKMDTRTQQRLNLVINELNHRVRNILTLVQSLSVNLASSAESVDGYATALEKRIVALASAHDLLTKDNMRGLSLRKLAEVELKPYTHERESAATLAGPELILKSDVSSIVALLFHELTSNSVKYGALSTDKGAVSLEWHTTEFGLEINWRESGGPAVSKPTHEGFGSSIINNAVPYEFGGTAQVSFNPTGLEATFTLPKNEFEIVLSPTPEFPDESDGVFSPSFVKLTIKRGLIVEDNYIIANQSKRLFEKIGFQDTVAVATISAALAQLEQSQFDFCLLDVNLRGEMSGPVAQKLEEMGIPFLFASGYGSGSTALSNQYNVPFLTKPIKSVELRAAIRDLGV